MTDEPDATRVDRRSVLSAAAGSALGGLAGCTGGRSREQPAGPLVVCSFFTFYDFARKIATDTPITVENLVPVGMHGHGWEPDPSITRRIVDADAFVHVGEDFQPWADRAIETVRDDGADTHLVNVREGVELLDLAETMDEEEESVGAGKDPHFWLDPTRAEVAVANLREGLRSIAPEHEATLSENAAALVDRLRSLDEEWSSVFDAAERDVVFLAAHNAFEYLGDRYGAHIQPLVTNLAASDDVRPEDVRRARETIAEHDIRYIGAAVFEPVRPAQQLVAESGVEAYFPVTPYAGTTQAWTERGWGYFEIARNVNVPTFEVVLGASSPAETELEDEWRNFEP